MGTKSKIRNPNYSSSMKTLRRFRDACFNEAFIGSSHPEERDDIREEYQNASIAMEETLIALTKK